MYISVYTYVCSCITNNMDIIHCNLSINILTVALTQPATGPSSVCEGSDMTLQCVIVSSFDNTTTVRDTVWTVAPDGILATTLPNHRVVRNSTTGGFTDLVITNVTLEDDNAVYTCSTNGNTITSSIVLNVTGNLIICRHD